ncbi:hypothetical protein OKW27_000440 [Paraburkholderia sp. 35.1]
MRVSEHLHLDMACVAHQLFHIHFVVAECSERFPSGRGKRCLEILLAFQHPHASPATAPACLEHQRVAHSRRKTFAFVEIAWQRVRRGHHRHAGSDRRVTRRHLVAEHAHDFRGGAAPAYAGVDHSQRKIGILREETVTRMNGVDLRLPRYPQDVVNIEVGRERLFALTHQVALISLETMKGESVFLRIDGHRTDVHLSGRPHHTDRDLGAVGDQQGFDRKVVHDRQGLVWGRDAWRTRRRKRTAVAPAVRGG